MESIGLQMNWNLLYFLQCRANILSQILMDIHMTFYHHHLTAHGNLGILLRCLYLVFLLLPIWWSWTFDKAFHLRFWKENQQRRFHEHNSHEVISKYSQSLSFAFQIVWFDRLECTLALHKWLFHSYFSQSCNQNILLHCLLQIQCPSFMYLASHKA